MNARNLMSACLLLLTTNLGAETLPDSKELLTQARSGAAEMPAPESKPKAAASASDGRLLYRCVSLEDWRARYLPRSFKLSLVGLETEFYFPGNLWRKGKVLHSRWRDVGVRDWVAVTNLEGVCPECMSNEFQLDRKMIGGDDGNVLAVFDFRGSAPDSSVGDTVYHDEKFHCSRDVGQPPSR